MGYEAGTLAMFFLFFAAGFLACAISLKAEWRD
jgi:hypothetical protein